MIYESDFDREDLFQSDIFENIHFSCEDKSFNAILLTPVCDLVIQKGKSKPKATYLKFAGIVDFKPILQNILSQLRISKYQMAGKEYIDGETYLNLLVLLRQLINGSIYPRYYYLPPLPNYYNHSLIDFQLVEVVKFTKDIKKELLTKKISTVKSSWKESIPVRYSTYFSRVGVEDITDNIIDKISLDYKFNFNRIS